MTRSQPRRKSSAVVGQVPAGHSPSAKKLPAQLDPSHRSGNMLNLLFGLDKDSSALFHVPGSAVLKNQNGIVIDQCSYQGTSQGYTYC